MTSDKFILDATAGFRMMWFNKNNPYTIYYDEKSDEILRRQNAEFGSKRHPGRIRKEWNPIIETTVGDFRHLPYPDKSFKLVVFDPPHFIQGWCNPKFCLNVAFGLLNPETWQSDLQKAITEIWRVLVDFGVLVFKWSDHDIHWRKVLKFFPEKPLFGNTVTNRTTKHGKYGTYWFCFMKIPDQEAKP